MSGERLEQLLKAVAFTPTPAQLVLLRFLLFGERGRAPGLKLPAPRPETLLLAGRASGKTSLAVLAGLFTALQNPGAEVLLVGPSLDVGQDVLMKRAREYARCLEPLIVPRAEDALRTGSTRGRLEFRNGATLTVLPCLERAVRGRAPLLAVLDECAQFAEVSSNGAALSDILGALRSRMRAQYGDAHRIVMLTTPRRPAGLVYEMATNPPEHLAVVTASTMIMRPNLSRRQLAKGLAPAEFAREIEAQFTADDDSIIDLEALASCSRPEGELPAPASAPVIGVDLATRRDMTGIAVVSEGAGANELVVHALRRLRVARDLSNLVPLLRELQGRWGPYEIIFDQWSGDAVKALLALHGIDITIAPWTSANRDAAFAALGAAVTAGTVVLPRSPELRQEVAALRTTWTRTGLRRIEAQNSARTGGSHGDLLSALLLCVSRFREHGAFRFRTFDDEEADKWAPVAF